MRLTKAPKTPKNVVITLFSIPTHFKQKLVTVNFFGYESHNFLKDP